MKHIFYCKLAKHFFMILLKIQNCIKLKLSLNKTWLLIWRIFLWQAYYFGMRHGATEYSIICDTELQNTALYAASFHAFYDSAIPKLLVFSLPTLSLYDSQGLESICVISGTGTVASVLWRDGYRFYTIC